MDVDKMVKRIMPWLPLMIAAGYFLYLIATWQKYLTFQAEMKAEMNAKLDEFLASRDERHDG